MKKLLVNLVAAGAILGTSIVAHADDPGWQFKYSDTYIIEDDSLTTHIRSLDGGGVKICFDDVDYEYTVTLKEADKLSDDDYVGARKKLYPKSDQRQCLEWSKVNSEDGPEELYLNLSRSSFKNDKITIRWYD
ncbi:hypothetical protein [Exiguobacterium sp. R-39]|uniref:hypothetical protein n=1 Tax=Exiguobacterium sp. R-39 TaxID=3416708 RepID=UPI003CF76393